MRAKISPRRSAAGRLAPDGGDQSKLSVDEAGHFEGELIPNRLEIDGTFLSPTRVKGTIVSLETTGLPGCTRKAVQFSAHPK